MLGIYQFEIEFLKCGVRVDIVSINGSVIERSKYRKGRKGKENEGDKKRELKEELFKKSQKEIFICVGNFYMIGIMGYWN